jgi:hypothetical protein
MPYSGIGPGGRKAKDAEAGRSDCSEGVRGYLQPHNFKFGVGRAKPWGRARESKRH